MTELKDAFPTTTPFGSNTEIDDKLVDNRSNWQISKIIKRTVV